MKLRDRKPITILAMTIAPVACVYGFFIFAIVADSSVFDGAPMTVVEKSSSAPRRYRIVIKTEPNENGGTAAVDSAYSKSFYDHVQLGDVFYPSICHYGVYRNGKRIATHVPSLMIKPFLIFLLWSCPMMTWLPGPKLFASWPVALAAIGIELWALAVLFRFTYIMIPA